MLFVAEAFRVSSKSFSCKEHKEYKGSRCEFAVEPGPESRELADGAGEDATGANGG